MNVPASRWHRVIEGRRSRRHFVERLPKENQLNNIQLICNSFQPFGNARAILVKEAPAQVFKGISIIGSYGRIRGAKAFLAFVGNTKSPMVQEQVGYTGEGIILEAEAMNLNTCWVGGSFRREVVNSLIDIRQDEKVFAITPIGYAIKKPKFEEKLMTVFGLAHRRKPLSDLVIGLKEAEWPKWMKASLEAARLAPSAINRQPWRFIAEENIITVALNDKKLQIDSTMSKRLCCGIAMLHIEVAAMTYGIKGNWVFLNPPGVARFIVNSNK
ncbi:nitroreductase family protein [Chloroflexota bacterium]